MNDPIRPSSRPEWSRADLLALLAELEVGAPLLSCSPAELLRALDGSLETWRLRGAARRGVEELERVHRREVARLLREAAAMRRRLELFAALYPYADPDPGRAALPDWTRRAVAEIEALHLDRLALAGARLLADCLLRAPHRWPAASLLAGAALETCDGPWGRLELGRAHLAEGDGRAASRIFYGLVQADGSASGGQTLWHALEGLACAHEQLGSDRLALGACGAAARVRDCGPGPLVAGCFLALTLEDDGRAWLAARALDRVASAGDPELDDALARLGRRIELFREGLPWSGSERGAALLAEFAGDTGAGAVPGERGGCATRALGQALSGSRVG